MNVTSTLLIPVVGMIVIPIVLHLRSQRRADIRYNLSGPIQIPQTKGEHKNWQQIQVKNSGKVEANRLQLKVRASIVHHDLKKNSQADKPEVFNTRDGLEVVYPLLPPGGEFVLTLATTGQTIDASSVNIFHSKGGATEAFSGKGNWLMIVQSLALFVATILFVTSSVRSTLSSSLQSDSHFHKPPEFLARAKPFYVSSREWQNYRDNAISRIVGRFSRDISESSAYRLLCEDRPVYLSTVEWDALREDAITAFESNFKQAVSAAVYPSEVLSLLRLRQPVQLSAETWMRLKTCAEDQFSRLLTREHNYADISAFPKLLKQTKPEGVSDSLWENYMAELEDAYCEKIRAAIDWADKPDEYLRTIDPTLIRADKMDRLREVTQRRAAELLPDLYDLDQAKRFVESPSSGVVDQKDLAKYRARAEKTIEFHLLRTSYDERVEKLAASERTVATQIARVTRQLSVIDSLLVDPNSISKVEELDNPFAPGNFENLKELASLLKERKQMRNGIQ